jgi:hypothetical protein
LILRRLSQSLKQQNWAAIWIEFILLVSGVFLGLQVSNWNEERELNKKATIFTERLQDDLRYELWAEKLLIEYYKDVQDNTVLALGELTGEKPTTDEQFLISAYRSSQYRWNIQQRATYDELVSTGSISLIADAKMRELAMYMFTNPMNSDNMKDAKDSEYRKLFRENVAADVQQELLNACGDKTVETLDYANLTGQIDYDCTLNLPADKIRTAVSALKAQARIIPALQKRYADLGTAIYDTSFNHANNIKLLKVKE